MARSVPEWIGASDDTLVPPRVRLRVFERDGGCCRDCGRKIVAGEAWQTDHIVAVVNGGANCENNLQTLCGLHHGKKTARDLAEKSAVAATRLKHLGVKKYKRPMPGSRRSKLKRKMDGSVVYRETNEPLRSSPAFVR